MICSHRLYYKIYPVQQALNSTTSGREFPVLMQLFEEVLKSKTYEFLSRIDGLIISMGQIRQFSNLMKWGILMEI